MHTAAIHKANHLQIETSFFTAINVKKSRRYKLCLGFVQTIVQDFFTIEKKDAGELFTTLGQVACCIDTHLDDLTLHQKQQLCREFPVFFDNLGEVKSEEAFAYHLSALCTSIGTSLYPPSAAKMLFGFYQYCLNQELLSELKAFSQSVIISGINKAEAKTGNEVLSSIAMEGGAAIHFLLLLLEKENIINKKKKNFIKLKSYLSRLERMLNIADDIADSRKDKKRETINLSTNFKYYFTLSTALFKTFFVTMLSNHILFLKHFSRFTIGYIRSELL